MSASGSFVSTLCRRGPFIPGIACPDCGRQVELKRSGMKEHDGWMYYKCLKHGRGCDFWYWELEYVIYLLEHNYIVGDDGVEALGWAEERREELKLRAQEQATISLGQDEMVTKNWRPLLHQMKEAVLILKIIACLLALVLVVIINKK